MFLFDRPYQYFEEPWPHVIIENALPNDAAERMLICWPENSHRHYGNAVKYPDKWHGDYKDQVFNDFEKINFVDRADDMLKKLAEIFDEPNFDDCKIDGVLYNNIKFDENLKYKKIENVVSETGEIVGQKKMLKHWHVDNLRKKYLGLLYIGSGENSEFIAKNKKTGVDKTYEYEHNRFIIWRNTSDTLHKFYCGVESRKTIMIEFNWLNQLHCYS